MTTQQPEALRLAELLELAPEDGVEPQTTEDAAAELRRQQARIAELEAQLEAIGAGGVSGPLMGCASISASAGSEPVARVTDDGFIVEIGDLPIAPGQKLYLHPSPPEGMVGGWTKASQQLPPCSDDQLYIGINTAGFAGVFNALIDIAGNVHCMYVTPVEVIDVMGSLDIWQPFTPPTTSAGSGKEE